MLKTIFCFLLEIQKLKLQSLSTFIKKIILPTKQITAENRWKITLTYMSISG